MEKERDSCSSEKGKVINLEENLELERRTFAEDLDEKQKMIAKLSKQLEVHEKNFEALKSELTQVYAKITISCHIFMSWLKWFEPAAALCSGLSECFEVHGCWKKVAV